MCGACDEAIEEGTGVHLITLLSKVGQEEEYD